MGKVISGGWRRQKIQEGNREEEDRIGEESLITEDSGGESCKEGHQRW